LRPARREHPRAVLRAGRREKCEGIHPEFHEHHERKRRRATQQERGFHDLHPGGREHSSENHIRYHRCSDDDHRRLIAEPEHQLDEAAAADHLGDQIENDR
jgi:hypothetical protein